MGFAFFMFIPVLPKGVPRQKKPQEIIMQKLILSAKLFFYNISYCFCL